VLFQQVLHLMQMLLHIFSVMRFLVFGHDALFGQTVAIIMAIVNKLGGWRVK
jgi:hypothetical protein